MCAVTWTQPSGASNPRRSMLVRSCSAPRETSASMVAASRPRCCKSAATISESPSALNERRSTGSPPAAIALCQQARQPRCGHTLQLAVGQSLLGDDPAGGDAVATLVAQHRIRITEMGTEGQQQVDRSMPGGDGAAVGEDGRPELTRQRVRGRRLLCRRVARPHRHANTGHAERQHLATIGHARV